MARNRNGVQVDATVVTRRGISSFSRRVSPTYDLEALKADFEAWLDDMAGEA